MKSNRTSIITLLLFFIAGCTSKIDFEILPPAPPTFTSDVLISEISTAINTDPAANGTRTHYVELFNGTNSSVDLSNYAIGYFAVTDTFTLAPWNFTAGNSFVLRNQLAAGKCYVIASPQADPVAVKRDTIWGTTSTLAAQSSSPLQLSGNSGIALLKKDASGTISLSGSNYRIIDAFGSPLVARVNTQGATSARNNIMWTIAGETRDTRNRTFFRKASVLNPTTNWLSSKGSTADNSEWIISGDRAWSYSNVGLPTK
jgi:hypothetical protein